MIEIKWKGKIGYGDIVSPICYAHNVSYFTGQEVRLVFIWENGVDHKYDPTFSECLWEQANWINDRVAKRETRVIVDHMFDTKLNINHTNYTWDIVGKDAFHNFWLPAEKIRNRPLTQNIVINTTCNNIELFPRDKKWKDPLGPDKWSVIVKRLQYDMGIHVIEVSYKTPIKELVGYLSEARAFIGYHGSCAWLARLCLTPSIIVADGGQLTRDAFVNARVVTSLDPDTLQQNLDMLIGNARVASANVVERFKQHNFPRETLRHLKIT